MTVKSDALKDIASTYERTLGSAEFGTPCRFEQIVDSTSDIAREWALRGGPHGALVFADQQIRGRGRRGRIWQTQPGVNLTISMILRPEYLPCEVGLITLAAGFAMLKILERSFPVLNIKIKWPNDVLIGSRKCAGILLESSTAGEGSEKFAILGVGLNVNQTTFPDDLEQSATSVILETGQPQDRMGLLVAFVKELEIRIIQISKDKKGFLSEYESHLAGIGSAVSLSSFDAGPTISGTILGVTDDGSMRLQTTSGVKVVYAGDVTFDNDSDE